MQEKGSSENHQVNNLKVVIDFANFLGPDITFYNISKREQITAFLNTKIKSYDIDPDKRWITTWNHFLNRIKLFMRWLYNHHKNRLINNDDDNDNDIDDYAAYQMGYRNGIFDRLSKTSYTDISPFDDKDGKTSYKIGYRAGWDSGK
jgi:hypothetical protein